MALINCPQCHNLISDKTSKCPHCRLIFEASYDSRTPENIELDDIKYDTISNIIISFDKDYSDLFSANHYITHREKELFHSLYEKYYTSLKNKLIFQYVCNNAAAFRIDIEDVKRFLRKMHTLNESITTHNEEYIERTLIQEDQYFDKKT